MGVPAACPQPANVQPDVFPVTVGTVTSADGRQWTMPAPVNDTGPIAVDLYNNCMGTGDNPNYTSIRNNRLNVLQHVPIHGRPGTQAEFAKILGGRFVPDSHGPLILPTTTSSSQ